MPDYRGMVTEQERRETLSTAGADYGTYTDLVRNAAEGNPDGTLHKFGLSADEVTERRAHKRRFKAAAEMAGYTLEWLPDPQKRIAPDELWARLYRHGHAPPKRQRRPRLKEE